jgi:hypothetical protein
MYYTGIDPLTMKKVFVADDPQEKRLQRALLQCNRPENAALVREALRKVGREDLIGFAPSCLVRPEGAGRPAADKKGGKRGEKAAAPAPKGARGERKTGDRQEKTKKARPATPKTRNVTQKSAKNTSGGKKNAPRGGKR